VYKILKNKKSEKFMQHVPWIEYSYIKSDLEATYFQKSKTTKRDNYTEQEKQLTSEPNPEEDPYIPPKIEEIDNNSKKSPKKKVNLREFF
jgi:hypothetical protein